MKTSKKKIRGLSRRFRLLKERVIENTKEFPRTEERYWHLHIPCSSDLLVSSKVKHRYKQQVVSLLIERAEILNSLKVTDQFCRVVCCLTTSNLWYSQIIIFFSEDYYNSFFDRDNEYQKWMPIESNRAFINSWNVEPGVAKIKGYYEIIKDEDETFESELWFYECNH